MSGRELTGRNALRRDRRFGSLEKISLQPLHELLAVGIARQRARRDVRARPEAECAALQVVAHPLQHALVGFLAGGRSCEQADGDGDAHGEAEGFAFAIVDDG